MIEKSTKLINYQLLEDGIIRSHVKEGSYISFQDTKEGFELMKSMVPDGKLYIMSELSGIKGTDKESRKFASDKEFGDKVAAIAFITGSGAAKVVANFVLRLYRTPYTTKMFTDRDKAIAWLKEQKDATTD